MPVSMLTKSLLWTQLTYYMKHAKNTTKGKDKKKGQKDGMQGRER